MIERTYLTVKKKKKKKKKNGNNIVIMESLRATWMKK